MGKCARLSFLSCFGLLFHNPRVGAGVPPQWAHPAGHCLQGPPHFFNYFLTSAVKPWPCSVHIYQCTSFLLLCLYPPPFFCHLLLVPFILPVPPFCLHVYASFYDLTLPPSLLPMVPFLCWSCCICNCFVTMFSPIFLYNLSPILIL